MNWRKMFSMNNVSSIKVELIIKLYRSLGFGFYRNMCIAQGLINNGASIQLTSGSTIDVDFGSTIGNSKNLDNAAFTGTVMNSGTLLVSGDWINNSNDVVFPSNCGTVVLNGIYQ